MDVLTFLATAMFDSIVVMMPGHVVLASLLSSANP